MGISTEKPCLACSVGFSETRVIETQKSKARLVLSASVSFCVTGADRGCQGLDLSKAFPEALMFKASLVYKS